MLQFPPTDYRRYVSVTNTGGGKEGVPLKNYKFPFRFTELFQWFLVKLLKNEGLESASVILWQDGKDYYYFESLCTYNVYIRKHFLYNNIKKICAM